MSIKTKTKDFLLQLQGLLTQYNAVLQATEHEGEIQITVSQCELDHEVILTRDDKLSGEDRFFVKLVDIKD